MKTLQSAFFARHAVTVAKDLLGMWLVHDVAPDVRLVGRIVETEAYRGEEPACHAWGNIGPDGPVRPEGRGALLFAAPGTAYIHLTYGIHWLLNVVSEPEGHPAGVLIRAVEPLAGIQHLQQNRPIAHNRRELTNGPGKLTQAFGIDGALPITTLLEPPLYFAEPDEKSKLEIATSSRIGITKAIDLPWRFFLRNHPFVSKGIPSDAR